MQRLLCLGLGLVAAAGLAAGPSPASAQETVTFSFGGTLDVVDPSLTGVFSIGDPFTGTLTYRLDLEDMLPDNDGFGQYPDGTVVGFTYVINGTHTATADWGSINVVPSNVMDILVRDGFNGDAAAGMTPQFANVPLFDADGNVLVTDALPQNPFPSMSEFGSPRFRVRFGPTWNENEVEGAISTDGLTPARETTWGRVKALYGP